MGLLFGTVETQKPKADTSGGNKPVRGRSVSYSSSSTEEGDSSREKVVVRVAAVMEVDAAFQQHG